MPEIKLNASLRSAAGVKTVSVHGSKLIEAIRDLVRIYPDLAHLIFEDGEIREHFVVTINGHHSTDPDQAVNEDDNIAIFPPISGG